MRPYPVRARSICKSPQNASRGNARRRNESPPKRRGHNTMRSYPVHAPAASASRRKMRPAATHAGKTNRRRTRTRCKVTGDVEKHLLFHNPRLRTRSQSPAERHKAKCRKRVGSPATRSRPPSRRCEPSPPSRRSKRPPRAPVFCSPWPAGRRSPRPRTKSS